MTIQPDLDLAHANIPAESADLILFGSRARGDTRRCSDIDVGVRPLRPLPAGLLVQTRSALEESNLLLNVDLIILEEADPAPCAAIDREGKPWNA